jgi:hypothetical protein
MWTIDSSIFEMSPNFTFTVLRREPVYGIQGFGAAGIFYVCLIAEAPVRACDLCWIRGAKTLFSNHSDILSFLLVFSSDGVLPNLGSIYHGKRFRDFFICLRNSCDKRLVLMDGQFGNVLLLPPLYKIYTHYVAYFTVQISFATLGILM